MKLSIVIPAYNEERFIAECLSYVERELEGAPFPYEVIVVNNTSTDKTKEIALGFRGVRVVDEPKKGLTCARQAGFVASTGDLIANVDADTHMPRGWTTTVMQEFAKNPKLVALSGPYVYYDVSPAVRALAKFWYAIGLASHLVTHRLFGGSGMLQGGNFVLRRTALETIGGFDTTIAFYGEETDIAARIAKLGIIKWTWRLPMGTSGRRFRGDGLIKTGFHYAINFAWVSLWGKPYTHTYTDIRQ